MPFHQRMPFQRNTFLPPTHLLTDPPTYPPTWSVPQAPQRRTALWPPWQRQDAAGQGRGHSVQLQLHECQGTGAHQHVRRGERVPGEASGCRAPQGCCVEAASRDQSSSTCMSGRASAR